MEESGQNKQTNKQDFSIGGMSSASHLLHSQALVLHLQYEYRKKNKYMKDWGNQETVSVRRVSDEEGQMAGLYIIVTTYDSVVHSGNTIIVYLQGQVSMATTVLNLYQILPG